MLGHSSAALTLDTYADLFDSDLGRVARHLTCANLERPRQDSNLRPTD